MHDQRSGFTLIELSIVIIILGLIMGGILVGQAMIRNSRLQAMIGEYDANMQAIASFKDKYMALPGDYSMAESQWGSDSLCPNTVSNLITKSSTCNGNGDGRIGTTNTDGSIGNTYEWFRAWQHLSNANMLPGMYTGVSASVSSSYASLPGTNIPSSKMKSGGWGILYYLYKSGVYFCAGCASVNKSLFSDLYGHVLTFGATDSGYIAHKPILTPIEASTVDMKIDDGLPGHGKMREPVTSASPNCLKTTSTSDSAKYDVSKSNILCAPVFILGL